MTFVKIVAAIMPISTMHQKLNCLYSKEYSSAGSAYWYWSERYCAQKISVSSWIKLACVKAAFPKSAQVYPPRCAKIMKIEHETCVNVRVFQICVYVA